MLLVFYGFLPTMMVGTDIIHAVMLAGMTGSLQFKLGNVDIALVLCLLIDSVPGGLLGAYLTHHVWSSRLKHVFSTLLMAVGARMLWGV